MGRKRCARRGRASRKNHRAKGRQKVPRATVSTVPERHDLKTAPPDGYVLLRRMSFGELLASQGMSFQVQMKASQSSGDPDVGVNITQATVMEYQFKTCIAEHNLENETGQLLNFQNSPKDVHTLDPRIGGEIANIIEKMHNWSEQFPNSETPSVPASSANGAGVMATAPAETSPTSSSE